MRLYAWTRPDERGGAAMVGIIEVGPTGATLESCRDPELASALAQLSAETHLPLTVRQMVGGSRHVRAERLKPGDADYWRALAEGLTRRTGHSVTDSDRPPA
jgi:hypothetical protein